MRNKTYYVGTAFLCGAFLMISLLFGGTLVSVYTGIISESIGISRASFSIFNLCRCLVGFFIGLQFIKITRWMRIKYMIAAGCFLVSAMLFGLTLCFNLTTVVGIAIIGGIGTSFCGVIPITLVVRNWYRKSYGTILALVMSASGISGTIVTPILSSDVDRCGWKKGFMILSAISFMLCLIALFVFKEEPSLVVMEPYGGGSVSAQDASTVGKISNLSLFGRGENERNMRKLMIMNLLFAVGALCVYTNISSVVADIGFSITFATGTAVSIASLFSFLGKIIMGKISDRFGMKYMAYIWYGMCPIAMLFFMLFRSAVLPVVLVGIVLIGLVSGIYSVPIPIIASSFFRKEEDYARVISMCSAASSIGTSVSGVILHRFYDVTGTYVGALLFSLITSGIMLITAISMLRKGE